MHRLALVLALGSAACTEHAPSFGRLTLSDGGTTEPLVEGESSGGGSTGGSGGSTGTTDASTGSGTDTGAGTSGASISGGGADAGTTGAAASSNSGDTSGDETTGGTKPFCGDGVVNQDFEECDIPSPDPEGPCTATCQRARVIFVLSISVQGKLGGLQGADAYCRSQAVKAKMADPDSPIQDPGNFKALLSSSTETFFGRHLRGNGPYRLVNGLTVSDSFNQLFSDPLQNPINVDEFSHTREISVWTATTKDGPPYPGVNFCNDWTSVKGSSSQGHSTYTDQSWIELPDWVAGQPTETCANESALYCVEQQ
jgi:Protein of unknown function (DUF1554)